MKARGVLCFLLLGLTACGSGDKTGGGDADTDSDVDTDGDSDVDSDADTDTDTDVGGYENDCFDGEDDDADGQIDCADTECSADAACVHISDGLGLEAGVTVGEDDPCPAGFEGGETLVHRGLQPGDCEGCNCVPGTTECTASLWYYTSNASCVGDAALDGGVEVGAALSAACGNPIYDGSLYGVRAEIVADQSCTPDGAASVTSTWDETVKFCRASDVGGGCPPSQECVRRPGAAVQCALADGPIACEGYASTETDWFTDVDDSRVCGDCECTASGGGCSEMSVGLGSDWSCTDDVSVGDGEKTCSYSYSPPARLLGAPVDPDACEATAEHTGEIAPIGASTLCCNR